MPTPPPGARSGPNGQTTGSAQHGGHQETQLDPIATGWQLQPGPPDYTHAVLPFIYERTFKYNVQGTTNVLDFGLRMTSPYDPIIEPAASATDINAGTGTQTNRPIRTEATDTRTDNAAAVGYWDFYASMYKYYSVLGCRYKIRVENLSHEKFFVHKMFINNDRPNPAASNWDMKLWRGVDSRLITPMMRFGDAHMIWNNEQFGYNVEDDDDGMAASGTTNATGANTFNPVNNPIGSAMTYYVGEYRPGDYQREVKLDSDVEIWTAVNANPKLPEILFLRTRAYDNATPDFGGDVFSYNREISFNLTVECEYLVEFKELQDVLYRPASRNPLVVLPNPVDQDNAA